MSQRREIEGRLALYDDLSGIMRAMRSFALAELHRVARRETAQNKVMEILAETLRDLSPAMPAPPECTGDVWLLFGSVRGFCGSFNEDVMRGLQAAGRQAAPVVVVGERLAANLADGPSRFVVPGPLGAVDAAAAVERLLPALDAARQLIPGEAGVMVCYRDETAARSERLLPLPAAMANATRSGATRFLPLLQEPASRVAEQVMAHYLFHALLVRLLHAIRVENRMRLTQMENALRHLERSGEDLLLQRNRLRQEEIVEEIEVIVSQ
jgi:F-type H+-transporting ATPase subunit gamma